MAESSKKRRVDKGAGVDLAQPKPQAAPKLVCEEAAVVLTQYSLGIQRVPLKGLGVSSINRDISGSHVHTLGRHILTVEGVRVVVVQTWLGT